METFLFYGLLVFAFYMIRKNLGLMRRNKHNKEYVQIAGEIFARKDSAREHVERYISQQSDVEFQNKARILALYEALEYHQEVEETLHALDLTSLLSVQKGVSTTLFEPRKVMMNSDSMVWSMMVLTKMKAEHRIDLIPLFVQKFLFPEELRKHMEFQLIEAIAAYYTSEEKDIRLFSSISNSEYSDVLYDKQLIGLYKRLSSFFLYLEGIEGEHVSSDIKSFAQSSVGKMMMEDLGIQLPTEEAVIDEEKPEEETMA